LTQRNFAPVVLVQFSMLRKRILHNVVVAEALRYHSVVSPCCRIIPFYCIPHSFSSKVCIEISRKDRRFVSSNLFEVITNFPSRNCALKFELYTYIKHRERSADFSFIMRIFPPSGMLSPKQPADVRVSQLFDRLCSLNGRVEEFSSITYDQWWV